MPMIPMAISLGFGVLYASIMTLVLVPAGYVILDDLVRLLKREDVDSRSERSVRAEVKAPDPSIA
jgi:hypothetical protein